MNELADTQLKIKIKVRFHAPPILFSRIDVFLSNHTIGSERSLPPIEYVGSMSLMNKILEQEAEFTTVGTLFGYSVLLDNHSGQDIVETNITIERERWTKQ